MPTSKEHYERVLSRVYAWMLGGFDVALERNTGFFAEHGITGPRGSGVAVDLGAGCGFQSIPLARLGYAVTAIDLDASLLAELGEHAENLPIVCVEDDLLRFGKHVRDVELAVCMTDTLLHLESREDALALVAAVGEALEPGGRFVVTFRDLTHTLSELDRFIPVRSDEHTIMTCFLEYEPDTVKVHDLVHRRRSEGWRFEKSFYRKLRLAPDRVADAFGRAGFTDVAVSDRAGMTTIVGHKT